MGDKKHLQYSILKYLDEESKNLSEDQRESLEVATQCLETVFDISLEGEDASKYGVPSGLNQIFEAGMASLGLEVVRNIESLAAGSVDKEKAEKHKSEGNELMKKEEFSKALECYTEAVKADHTNAVYFCNRAAAHSKLNNHKEAINDCEKALEIDPNYSKAYGRKGLAHSALEEHRDALGCYKKALQLDPSNSSYQQNIEIAELKVAEMDGGPAGALPGGMNLGGLNMAGMDFSQLLNNPALMNMASSMMTNPQMQQMMASFMGTAGQQQGGPEGISGLLQAGQQLAQQMQQANPELVEELRNQMRTDGSEGNPDEAENQ